MSLVYCTGDTDRRTAGEPAPVLAADAPPTLRILIIGGTRGIGLETAVLALERGHRVTVMARRPERMRLSHPRLTRIGGDIGDAAAVAAAMRGQDAVVTAISLPPTRKPVTVFSQGIRNVLAAMASAHTPRLVAVTGIGAGDSRGHGGFLYDRITQPLLLKTIYEDKDREEALIRRSATDWTILRPGFLNDGDGERRYRVINDLKDIKSGGIARADVAHFILAALESGAYSGATVLLSN